ncbi:MAG: tRNA uridine-5-carboxymethylaminomethyl(34) synthesis GTPase MnmE [Nitrospira sp.]|nr:tRNA uridine-5-carboxymethylaminomethyl(34) synthesis GTPase MnmE [Nitrospira sp.]
MRGSLDDTICAIATPVGEGGVGIVRLSGPEALRIGETVVRLRSGRLLGAVATHTLHLADVLAPVLMTSREGTLGPSPGVFLDEALVVHMKAPRSFTGEDVVEIQSHGGGLILSLICQVCAEAGARPAEAGEFTKRAFLNGRLDLSQAEAVLDTVRARSAAALGLAQRQLRGELATEVESVRSALLRLLAHVEAGIDFVEEEISFVTGEELRRTIENAAVMIRRLADSFRQGKVLREGARVVILGRPNVGKSSLLNKLLREDRAIVTATPGTTRDVIEESIDLEGLRIHLIDTAGLRETEDPVELEGIKRTRSAQREADLSLVVVDGSQPLTHEDRQLIEATGAGLRVIVVNKADLPCVVPSEAMPSDALVCSVSTVTGVGLDRLRSEVRRQLISGGGDAGETVIVTNVRHHSALQRAAEAVDQALDSLEQGVAAELIAADLRVTTEALAEITGAITTDEILERVFAEFCIGK